MEYPDGTLDEISKPCGNLCSNFEAEAIAIESALLKIEEKFLQKAEIKSNVVIFSDSKSALEAIANESVKDNTIKSLLLTISSFIESTKTKITLQWIPSHCNIAGNERADTLAKQGAAKEQPLTAVSQTTVKQIIKSNTTIDWLSKWAQSNKGRSMFKFITAPNRNDPINRLKRKEQVTIFRLRTTHVPLNAHLNKILKDHPPNCTLCEHNLENVQHFLLDCPALVDLRRELLPENSTIETTLYSTDQQLRKTAKFFHMANGRRAQSHMTAGSRM